MDPEAYDKFATEYRANNHDAKDGEILQAYLQSEQQQQGK